MASQTNSAQPGSFWSYLTPLLRWPWELIPLLIVFLILYRQTMPPGLSSWIVEGWDSAMFQVTGSTWGIPHSPGYPLYTILANLFVRFLGLIPVLDIGSVVWRVTFWSTTTSLLTLLLMYSVVSKVTRNRWLALAATAILGVSFIFWRAAIMAEVYSLNALIFILTYWLAVVWHHNRRDRWLILLGLVLGAGLAHHRTAFILPPTIALWVALEREKKSTKTESGSANVSPRWRLVLWRWIILLIFVLLPLLTYLYLPWAAQNRVGQSWLYANASDWNTFWFIIVSREWWGLVEIPQSLAGWGAELANLLRQQAQQITIGGVILGIIGLATARRYALLFGPPFLLLVFFGVSYKVPDLDSMLIPLTMTLCIGLAISVGMIIRRLVNWIVRTIRAKGNQARVDTWLSAAMRTVISLVILVGTYFVYLPLAEANYQEVNLSGDWQAEDLVEEVVAIARAGTPLTIIGQDNSVLPDFIYADVVLNQPVEPLSTTTLSRLPEEASIELLRRRFEEGRRVLVDIETIELGFIPWLNEAIKSGQIFLAPTGHPFLWELLPRPMQQFLPKTEPWIEIPAGQFLDGKASIVAFHQQIIHKRTGCFLRLTLFWRVDQPLEEDYFVSVQPLGGETVLDKNDHLALMRGYLPTSQIQPGEIVRDEVDLLIRQPAALPSIMLLVNLFQVEGNQYPTFGEVTLPITVNPSACNST